MVPLRPEWSAPSTILFATECPPSETSFTFALARAKESRADLLLLHICDELTGASVHSAGKGGNYSHLEHLKPLIQRARELGVDCRAEVRTGITVDEILRFSREKKADCIILGAHTPGRAGRLLVGSVAETILREADVPVTIVNSFLQGNACCDFFTRTILCALNPHRSREAVARFGAEIAERHGARLVLQLVVAPQDYEDNFAGRTLDQMEHELAELIPASRREKLKIEAMAVLGDPTEELLYQARVLRANLIVMGARDATHFAALSNSGIVYKVLAYAPCPVVTLSPVALAACEPPRYGPVSETNWASDNYVLPGVV